MISKNWQKWCASILALWAAPVIFAAEPVSKSFFGDLAINGYDTVAYHESRALNDHKASKGKSEFTVEWKGAKWQFKDAKSADRFRNNPTRYSPAYNGHCANALSLGEGLIKTDGTHWEILGEKLYLFYREVGRDRWLNGNWQAFKKTADQAWAQILRE